MERGTWKLSHRLHKMYGGWHFSHKLEEYLLLLALRVSKPCAIHILFIRNLAQGLLVKVS